MADLSWEDGKNKQLVSVLVYCQQIIGHVIDKLSKEFRQVWQKSNRMICFGVLSFQDFSAADISIETRNQLTEALYNELMVAILKILDKLDLSSTAPKEVILKWFTCGSRPTKTCLQAYGNSQGPDQQGSSKKYHSICFRWELRKKITWIPPLIPSYII